MRRTAKVTSVSNGKVTIDLDFSTGDDGESPVSPPHEVALDAKLKKLSEHLVNFLLCQERGKEVFDPNHKFPELPSCIYSPSFLLRTKRQCSCLPTVCDKAYKDLIDITFVYTKALFEYGCEHIPCVISGIEDNDSTLNPLLMAMSVMVVPEDYAVRCFKGKNYEVVLEKDLKNSVELVVYQKCILEL